MAFGIGIVGLGVMGRRMLRNMTLHGGFRVAAASDPSPEARAAALKEVPGLELLPDAAAVARHGAVDCLYVASPPELHLAQGAEAFAAGKPLFIEKPLAIDIAAAEAFVARAEREGRPAAIDFPHASAPAVLKVQAALEEGTLGELRSLDLEIAFRRWPRDWQANAKGWLDRGRQGGFTREVLSHFFYLTARLLGPIEILDVAVEWEAEEALSERRVDLDLSVGGLPFHVHGGVGGDEEDHNAWTLEGSRGALRIHRWYSLAERRDGQWQDVDLGSDDIRQATYLAQLDSLARMLSGQPHPLPSLRQGLEVQKLVETVLGRGRDRSSR